MFGSITYGEMLLVGAFALLLFGSRLPEVARSLGGTYRELKKNVNEFTREFNSAQTYEPPPRRIEVVEEQEEVKQGSTAPKFAPPPPEDPPVG